MITGGAGWTAALNSETKRPLYVFSVPSKNISICSFFPLNLITGGGALLPILQIPQGASQKVDELNGHSSISSLDITAIDPGGQLKTLAADTSVIGAIAILKLGFAGLDLSDFVTLHTGRVSAVGRTADGWMNFSVADLLLNLVDTVFVNGGPVPIPASGTVVADNGIPASKENPRWFAGNPMDLLLAVLQNELGVGQASSPVLVVNTQGGSGTGQAGFGINPAWQKYVPGNDLTLINPNSFVDVPGVLALRDSQFAGDRMEFVITSSTSGKSWIEDQILKPLGLYWITRANGQLALKSMKHPAPGSITATAISEHQTLGIPEIARWPVINMINATVPADQESNKKITLSYVNQTSVDTYRAPYVHSVDSEGLRLSWGAGARLFLLTNRIFSRHGFATPEYTIKTFLKNMVLELGDFISLSHPLLLDLRTGTLGVANVLCEITDREPDYAEGTVTFKAIDTRFISAPSFAYKIADDAAGIPAWTLASAEQKAQYIFIGDATGHMSDGAAANQIS